MLLQVCGVELPDGTWGTVKACRSSDDCLFGSEGHVTFDLVTSIGHCLLGGIIALS